MSPEIYLGHILADYHYAGDGVMCRITNLFHKYEIQYKLAPPAENIIMIVCEHVLKLWLSRKFPI